MIFFLFSGVTGPGLRIGELPISAFIGILVGGFFILLLFIDCLCYCTNRCGLTMCICVHMCGKESPEEEEMQQAVEYGYVLHCLFVLENTTRI